MSMGHWYCVTADLILGTGRKIRLFWFETWKDEEIILLMFALFWKYRTTGILFPPFLCLWRRFWIQILESLPVGVMVDQVVLVVMVPPEGLEVMVAMTGWWVVVHLAVPRLASNHSVEMGTARNRIHKLLNFYGCNYRIHYHNLKWHLCLLHCFVV